MTAARTLTDSDMIVTLTRGELREIVTAAVREALEAKADDWIGPDEVAAMLGVARSTVPSLVARDGLPAARVARGYRFRRKEVVAWLEERITRPGGHSRPRETHESATVRAYSVRWIERMRARGVPPLFSPLPRSFR